MRSLIIVGIVATAASVACAQEALDLEGWLLPPEPAPEAAPANGNGPALQELLDNAVAGEPAAGPDGEPAEPAALADALQAEQREQVRREHEELKGRKSLEEADELLGQKRYRAAMDKYEQALREIPERPATAPLIQRARQRAAAAAMDWAEAEYARDNLPEARRLAEQARARDDSAAARADRLAARIARRQARIEDRAERPVPVRERPEIAETMRAVQADFEEGLRLFAVEEYDRAEDKFEVVLVRQPTHRDAMRALRAIQERRLAARQTHREVAIARMTDEVRQRWNPPIRQLVGPLDRPPEDLPDEARAAVRRMRERMETIVIPSLSFRDANIADVVNFLAEASRIHDPDGVGVNFVMRIGEEAPAPAVEDPWAAPFGAPAAAPAAPRAGERRVTLNLRQVTLMQALRYITEITHLRYRVEEFAVTILPEGVGTGDMVTRIYPVMPTIIEMSVSQAETMPDFTQPGRGMVTQATTMERDDVQALFRSFGVEFPAGSSISYNPANSRLTVVNTVENLEELERVLREINVIPSQVEIETRFVEVGQEDLEEFGFQWLLTDAWQLGTRRGTGRGAASERIQVNPNATGQGALGFTRGLRYFGSTQGDPAPVSRSVETQNALLGGLFSASSVLTNPELTMVLHAIEQSGGADLLSAPRIMTRSGGNAQIQVVKELLYPTEYIQQRQETMSSHYRPPIPSDFESRGVGVILNVTPQVGPDGYTIDLTLLPEVAELIGWIDYSPQGFYPIDMPIFTSRNIQSAIVIWDGQTVVMGGLISDRVVRMDDRIPLLGDVPLLGRLFRSKGEYSSKKNLMVFVTARIMDPSGAAIRDPKAASLGRPGAGPTVQ